MDTKNKDPLFKEKMILTIEYLVFTILFLILGILILVDIIPIKGTFRKVLIYVSTAGSLFIIFDLFWTIFSKKRRKKWSLIDKILAFPAGVSVFVVNILTFIWGFDNTIDLHETFVGYLFCYLAFVYLFEGIYHYFKPQPMLLEELKKEEEIKKETEQKPEVVEEDFMKKLKEVSSKKDEK